MMMTTHETDEFEHWYGTEAPDEHPEHRDYEFRMAQLAFAAGAASVKPSDEISHGRDSTCVEADGCPTEIAVLQREWRRLTAGGVSEDVQRWAIDIEKKLCVALGRSWAPSGMSVDSLVNDLIARSGRTEMNTTLIDTIYLDKLLNTPIPGGSQARDWFIPHDTERGTANVREVVRLMLERQHRLLIASQLEVKRLREALEYAYINYDKPAFAWEKVFQAIHTPINTAEADALIARVAELEAKLKLVLGARVEIKNVVLATRSNENARELCCAVVNELDSRRRAKSATSQQQELETAVPSSDR